MKLARLGELRVRNPRILLRVSDPAGEVVLCELRDGVAVVTLNRPARLNAWTYEMEQRYFEVLDRLADEPRVRAAVLTGAGRGFCPGLDLDLLREEAAGTLVKPAHRRLMTYAIGFPKPLVAAINGACAGVGLVQALACDVRFAATSANFSTAFARRGLIAEHGMAWLLLRIVGHAAALDLLLSGRKIAAAEAARLGLVNRAVADGELLSEALAYARELAEQCAPRAMADIKRQVWQDWLRTGEEAVAEGHRLVSTPERAVDLAEGVAAHVERRAPRFAPLPPRVER
jgi:enoyl-CoA hydratase/carnithine racemase